MSRLVSFPCVWLAAGVFGLASGVAWSDEPKKSDADQVKALIDRLPEVSEQDTGYSGSDSGSAFLPLGRNERGAALLSPRQGMYGSSDAMRSLVKLGVKAVPGLLDHLADDRMTKIELSHRGGFGGMFIGQDDGEKAEEEAGEGFERMTKYTVRVGDLCYVALGQIVNRSYTAVRYQPTAIIYVTCVPKSKELREGLRKEWGGLTADKHRESLAKDLDSDREHIREGASVRLAYYHPDAFETLALKQLDRPTYDVFAVEALVREKLYPAKSAKDRNVLVDEFVKKYGEIARNGICWQLFDDLDRPRARECLIDVFGYTDKVTAKDRPKTTPLAETAQARFVKTLLYDRGEKLDRAVRDILTKTDTDYLGEACLERLVGRGYDADIEAYLKRLLPLKKEVDQEYWRRYEAKLGWTRLHAAVELNAPDLIEAALKDKIDVDARGKDGRTALHLASADGKLGAVEQLLSAKANPNVKDGEGKLPVQRAAFADHAETVRRLVAGKSEVPDVFTAATVGATDRLAELLKADTGLVKARNEDGLTPLHVAAREGHDDAVRKLLVAGAEVTSVDAVTEKNRSSDGWTSLHLATMAGKAGAAKLLLANGAEVNAADKRGKLTPLHYAAWVGNADVVTLLLDRKADREAKDERDRTPLDLAKAGKHVAVVKLLDGSK